MRRSAASREAAKRLNISTSGLSHAIRRLEEQIGVRLLTRTTRSVSPTEAGEQLLAQLRPALADIRGTLTTLSGLQAKANRTRTAALPAPCREDRARARLGHFARTYPDVILEVTTDDSRVDLVAEGFERPSISASSSRRTWWRSASPRTSARRSSHAAAISVRATPSRHRRERCSSIDALTSGTEVRVNTDGSRIKRGLRWRFRSTGSLVVDDQDLVIQAALDGAGLAIVDDQRSAAHVKDGTLVAVLQDWLAPFPGFFLYYPHRKQQPAALTAVIESLRLQVVISLLSSRHRGTGSGLCLSQRAHRIDLRCARGGNPRRQQAHRHDQAEAREVGHRIGDVHDLRDQRAERRR